MKYSPRLNNLLKKHIRFLYTDPTLRTIFPQGCINSVFKRNQSLKELLAPSVYPNNKVNRADQITSCNKCDISKNYLIYFNQFTCSVTNRRYDTTGVLHWNCNNVIYLITCKNCLEQYVDSATNFKNRFRTHESDIKTSKDRRGTAKHFIACVKIIAIFFSFSLFKLLNEFIVMPHTLKKFYGTGKNVDKGSYLPRIMA